MLNSTQVGNLNLHRSVGVATHLASTSKPVNCGQTGLAHRPLVIVKHYPTLIPVFAKLGLSSQLLMVVCKTRTGLMDRATTLSDVHCRMSGSAMLYNTPLHQSTICKGHIQYCSSLMGVVITLPGAFKGLSGPVMLQKHRCAVYENKRYIHRWEVNVQATKNTLLTTASQAYLTIHLAT